MPESLTIDAARPLLEPLREFARLVSAQRIIVQDRDSGVIGPLFPTHGQTQVFAAMIEQAGQGRRVELDIPKARREGISTIIECINVVLCDLIPGRYSITYGHTDPATKAIFRLAKTCYEHLTGRRVDSETKIRFPNGSIYECSTYRALGAGRGGTPHSVHFTELAIGVSASGVDAKAVASAINALPDSAITMLAVESSGNGPVGEFHRRCMNARDGKGRSKLIFIPWFSDVRHVAPVPADFKRTESEESRAKQFKLSDAQLAWHRQKRAEQPDDNTMRREFPEVLDDCFCAGSGLVYHTFSSARIADGGNVGRLNIKPDWELYRAIDWGFSEFDPFVCLWIAHSRGHPPRLVIDSDPCCKPLVNEMTSYRRDEKTGKPMDENNHGCLHGTTKLLVRGLGWVRIDELIGAQGEAWTPLGWKPFWNVHQTSKSSEVWCIRLSNGREVLATSDHKILTSRGFLEVANLTVSDTIPLHGTDHHQRQKAKIRWKSVSSSQGGAVFLSINNRGRRQAASSRLGEGQWSDPRGSSCASHQWESTRQPPVQFGDADAARASIHALFQSRAQSAGTKTPGRRSASRQGMAWKPRGPGLAFEARKRGNRKSRLSSLPVRGLRQDISEPDNSKGSSPVLPSQLQNARVSKTAWRKNKVASVISKRPVGFHPVFDLTVDDAHCFTSESGTVVSNCDALRYAATLYRLTGLVYVYRAIYLKPCKSPSQAALEVHRLSGWDVPPNFDQAGLDWGRIVPGKRAEKYVGTVADRSQPGLIRQFQQWRISPIVGQRSPVDIGLKRSEESRGEIEDGIDFVLSLIAGDTLFFSTFEPQIDKIQRKIDAAENHEDGRPRRARLSPKEREIFLSRVRDETHEGGIGVTRIAV